MAAFAPSFQYKAMDIHPFPEKLSGQTSAMIIFQSLIFVQTASWKKEKAALHWFRAPFATGPLEIQR